MGGVRQQTLLLRGPQGRGQHTEQVWVKQDEGSVNAKTAKKIRWWANKRYTAQFREYTKLLQEQPFRERLYFAWVIVARRGYVKRQDRRRTDT